MSDYQQMMERFHRDMMADYHRAVCLNDAMNGIYGGHTSYDRELLSRAEADGVISTAERQLIQRYYRH